jgi:hypothetical protein
MVVQIMLRKGLSTLLASFLILQTGSIHAFEDPTKDTKEKHPGKLPAALDLLKYQTGIRNQGGRDVCPYFPPVAALEAAYRRAGTKVELSEEHLIWLRNVTCGSDKGKREVAENLVSTLGGGNGMGVLTTYAICRAQDMRYRQAVNQKGYGLEKYDWSKPFSQFVLNRWNLDPHQLPPAARANARYSISKYATMPAEDLKNPRKFEEILASEHEIIFTLVLHDDIHQVNPAQPVWRRQQGTKSIGLHFMLMVGYDSNRKFFIVKNQWGPTNYSGKKDRLDSGWKDIVRYDGYTLVDYNYLAECQEGHYITEIASIESPHFDAQRALGQWEVTFKNKNSSIMTGVLCWRRLPSDETGKLAIPQVDGRPPIKAEGEKANLRIGDLVMADGQEYRVNARFNGEETKPYSVSLAIDFGSGVIPANSMAGTTWTGSLTLPNTGNALMNLSPAGGAKEELFGVHTSDLQITATQVSDRNLLKSIKVTSDVTGKKK